MFFSSDISRKLFLSEILFFYWRYSKSFIH